VNKGLGQGKVEVDEGQWSMQVCEFPFSPSDEEERKEEEKGSNRPTIFILRTYRMVARTHTIGECDQLRRFILRLVLLSTTVTIERQQFEH
jgi:hypothetical protein